MPLLFKFLLCWLFIQYFWCLPPVVSKYEHSRSLEQHRIYIDDKQYHPTHIYFSGLEDNLVDLKSELDEDDEADDAEEWREEALGVSECLNQSYAS